MTATTEAPEVERPQARRHETEARKVAAVVAALDDLGVTGVFGRVRGDLDGAERLERALRDRQAATEQAERDLVDRLADGAALDDVAFDAAGLVRVDELAERAVAQRRARAVRSAAAEAAGAHSALARVVDTAAADAIEAGRELVDVGALARRLTPPPAPKGGWSYGRGGSTRSTTGGEHPWVTRPPVNLVDLDVVCAGDERLTVARIHAQAATERVHRAVEVAGMLAQVGGPASSLWPSGRDRDQVTYVGRLPAEVQLAVSAALGWEPKLRAKAPGPVRAEPPATPVADIARAPQVATRARRLLGIG